MALAEPGMGDRRLARVLGVPVDCLTMDEVLARVESFLATGRPHLIATADASGIAQAQTDPNLREIYESADLVTPDSNGVIWALRRSGISVKDRVSGVDVLDRICDLSAKKGYRIYLLGAEPGVADLAADRLRALHPGCNIVGTHHGYFKPVEDIEVAESVAMTKPDVVFVAMGIPRQEIFIRQTAHILGASVAMGVGGSLDVYSGRAKRAPAMIRRMKIEWLWRLMQNPSKIKKVMNLPRFAFMVWRDRP